MKNRPEGQQSIFDTLLKKITGSSESTDQPTKKINNWTLYTDGASRGNPGPGGAGVVLKKGNEFVFKKGFYLGTRTNNEAEYLAVLIGVYLAKQQMQDGEPLKVVSDSKVVINQLNGSYKVSNARLKLLYKVARKLLQGMNVSYKHVLREYNKEADSAANDGVDKKTALPLKFLDVLQEHEIYL